MGAKRLGCGGLAVLLSVMAFAGLFATGSAAAVTPHSAIVIDGDGAFTAANGVTGGSGTLQDPYVIEGWSITDNTVAALEIRNTRAPFIIRSVSVTGNGDADGVAFTNVSDGRVETSLFDTRLGCIRVLRSVAVTVVSNRLYNCNPGVIGKNSRGLVAEGNLVSGSQDGIVTLSSSDVVLDGNIVLGAFRNGIRSESMSNLTIVNNTVEYTFYGDGIRLIGGSGGNLSGNDLVSNAGAGVSILGFGRLAIAGNRFDSDGLMIYTITAGEIDFGLIGTDNTVNGLPLLVYRDCSSVTIDGIPVGEILIANCSRVRISNLTITNSDVGILTYGLRDSIIENNHLFGNHGYGIDLQVSSGVEVRRNNISDSGNGIYLDTCTQIRVSANEIANNPTGISAWDSSSIEIRGNEVTKSWAWGIIAAGYGAVIEDNRVSESGVGINVWISQSTVLRNNTLSDNGAGMAFWRDSRLTLRSNRFVNDSILFAPDVDEQGIVYLEGHSIGEDNTVNGLPILYRQGCQDLQVPGDQFGQIILVDCSNVTLEDVRAHRVTNAVHLAYVHGAVVDSATVDASYMGISVAWSGSVQIQRARLLGATYGVDVWQSHDVTVDGINASYGAVGVSVEGGGSVEIRRSDFVSNVMGIRLELPNGVLVHHNNFWNNTVFSAVKIGEGRAVWDAGYPAGGNYWGSPGPTDECSGPNQNVCTGGDGLSDVPMAVAGGGTDRYPLMSPNVDRENPSVVIESPSAGAILTVPSAVLRGTASDDGPRGVMRVEARANTNSWVVANGTSTWDAALSLRPGWNTLEARSWDFAATSSSPASVAVFYNSAPPTPAFFATPGRGVTGQPIQFDASASSDPDELSSTLVIRWDWEGDGTWDTDWSTGKVASHAYPTPGAYEARLEVRDFGGLVASATRTIVIASPLAVTPTASATSGPAPLDVHFDAGIAGGQPPIAVHWDFGDATSSTDAVTSHRYSAPGTYEVRLMVTDDMGQSVTRTLEIRVTEGGGLSILGVGWVGVGLAAAVVVVAISTAILVARRRAQRKPPRESRPPANP